MNSQIELPYLVDYCKQLPTYKDAHSITQLILEWGVDNNTVAAARLAIEEIREYFRQMAQTPETSEPKKLPAPKIETPEMPEFKFFHQVSDTDAEEFKEVLRECITKIDTDGKKEWFCIYAAWRYFQKEREAKAAYVSFFTDIDSLFPGLLKDLKADETTNRKYKPYCDMLRYEYNNWAVADGKLPPMQVWAHEEWTRQYKNSWETIKRMQGLVRDFYRAFAALFSHK